MLYMVGTLREAEKLRSRLPSNVFSDLVKSIVTLDREYGENRNYQERGGYSLVAETLEDVQKIKAYVNFDLHPGEWAEKISPDYICALYLLNDDYSIMVYMPLSVAPTAIIRDLED